MSSIRILTIALFMLLTCAARMEAQADEFLRKGTGSGLR